ncbi:MAG: hypothetical protein JW969_01995 [Spirochaetales bacterium]|nr:hypothetical protein [Spirochaetales bacterium]
MKWNKIVQLFSQRTDEGITFIEVIVSVTVLLIIGFSIWASFHSATRVALNIPDVAEENRNLILIDEYIRVVINEIHPPFWLGEWKPDLGDDVVTIPWYRGYRENTVSFEFSDKLLKITVEQTVLPDDDADDVSAAPDSGQDTDDTDSTENTEAAPAPANVQADDEPVITKTTETFGPYDDFKIEAAEDDDDNIYGLIITIKPDPDSYDTLELVGRFGTSCFWRP